MALQMSTLADRHGFKIQFDRHLRYFHLIGKFSSMLLQVYKKRTIAELKTCLHVAVFH